MAFRSISPSRPVKRRTIGCVRFCSARWFHKQCYKLQEWLNFITTELHKNFSPLFQPVIPDEVKNFFRDRIKGKFKYADSQLASKDYLMGKQFTVADGYLFVMLKWAERTGMDLSEFKNLTAFKDRVAARPNVQAALAMEAQAQKAA
jgi:glutathione S-transferase